MSTRSDACPLCGDPVAPDHAPFCSRRCRDRDLLKWLGEDYRLPVAPEEAPPDLDGGRERET
ncbi:MAG: DNA gyrase inhibitor YacG [Pseudomonadota bacterium]